MTRFIALYDGASVSTAEIVAITANPLIVNELGRRLAGETIGFSVPERQGDGPQGYAPERNGHGREYRWEDEEIDR